MRELRGHQAARAAILARPRLEDVAVPEAVAQGLRAVFGVELSPSAAVERILADVRTRGDEALLHYAQCFDKVSLPAIEVTEAEKQAGLAQVPGDVLEAMHSAAARIREFHASRVPATWVDFGRGLGQIVRPLDRVGCYVPGGRAAYPSTVLMTALPARAAGVPEVIIATPPDRGGRANPLVLAAASIAGAQRVFKMGGAQAIAALAYGTETVPQVDKICGPGNIFVTLAKRAVFGTVGIDGLHGPSEAVVLADASADPMLCAADLLAQAEHDELASALLITDSAALLDAVKLDLERQLRNLERAAIVRGALERNGMLILVDRLEEGIDLVNLFGPEHLSLMVRDPWGLLGVIRNTGAVFLGAASAAALGDYNAGPSHVMPTGGTVRFSSPLRTEDFLKVTSLVALDAGTAAALAGPAAALARAEGLTAHARAIEAHAGLRTAPRE